MRRKQFRKRLLTLFFAACLLINTCGTTVLAEESVSGGVTAMTAEDESQTDETTETPGKDTGMPDREGDGAEQSGQPSEDDASDPEDNSRDQSGQPSDSDPSDAADDDGEQTGQPSENDPSDPEEEGDGDEELSETESDTVEETDEEETEEAEEIEKVQALSADAATESDFTYTTADGKATITGYTSIDTELIIPDTLGGCAVAVIGKNAFSDCSSLTKVVIPDSVTEIGQQAFYSCTSLSEVNLPPELTQMGKRVFMNCSALKTITIPKSLQKAGGTISGDAVFVDSGLEEAVIEEGATEVVDYLFGNAKNLTNVTIPSTVTKIGENVFDGCIGLEKVVIPDSVTEIGEYAFYGCTSLSEVNLPPELTRMGKKVFMNCSALKTITIPKSLKKAGGTISGEAVFADSGLEEAVIEEGATEAVDYLFGNAKNLTNVTIPSTVTKIGQAAFMDCTGLTKIVIPDSVTEIGEYAFYGCTSLSEVNLSSELTRMGKKVFMNCSALKTITIPKSLKKAGGTISGEAVFADSGLEEAVIEEGATEVVDYLFGYAKNLTSVTIPSTVTKIGKEAFWACSSLERVEIPDSVTEIGQYAFYDCTALADANLPRSLLSIKGNAFKNCTSLTEVVIPKSLREVSSDAVFGGSGLTTATFEAGRTKIIDYLFMDCVNLTSVTIPETATEIGVSVFNGCTSLSEIEIPGGVTSIGNSAFKNCAKLAAVVIPDSVTAIGQYAFEGCTHMAQLVLSKRVTSIGEGAFRNCSSLPEVEIPKSLTSAVGIFDGCSALKKITFEEGTETIRDNLLKGCTGLEEIIIPETVTVIGRSAFEGCTGLKKIDIPNSVRSIGDRALCNCTALPAIEIPDGVETIGNYVFSGCSALISAEIADSVTDIGDSAFSGCSAMEAIVLPDSVINLGSSAFSGCTKLATVTLSQNLSAVKENTFKNSGLTAITVPASAVSIGNSAFRDCLSLTEVTLSEGLASIGNYAFNNCEKLPQITIPDSVNNLGTYVFAECDLLSDVTLGTRLTEIPSYAFNLCPALQKIVLPYSIQKIKDHAFTNCIALVDITIPRSTKYIDGDAISYAYLDKLTIRGVKDTAAHEYARERNVTFVEITIPAKEMKLSKKELSLHKGEQEALFLSVKPIDFTEVVTWRSEDETVATVTEEGIVTAKGVGKTQISVKIGDGKEFSDICEVTVVQLVESIRLDRWEIELEAWETYSLTAEVYPENALNKELAWRSSNEAVAVVDQDGEVKALTKGTATIYAEAQDGSGVYGSCTVTVVNSGYQCTRAEEMESLHDYLPNCTDFWVYTKEGAEKLTITFDELTEVEEGYDYIYIYDGNGKQVGSYTGKQLAGQTIEVTGDTVKIILETDDRGNMWGFKVVSISDPESVLEEDLPAGGIIPDGMWIAGIAQEGYAYTGSAIKPDVRVYDGSRRLRAGTDYTITYKNNTQANDASVPKTAPTITVKGKGNYSETVPVMFKINKVNLEDSSVTAAEIVLAPNNKVQKKVPVVMLNGKKLNKGRDFTVAYPDTVGDAYKNVGDYNVLLTGTGNFTGTKTVKLRITDMTLIEKAKIAKIPNKPYDNVNDLEDYEVTLSESDLIVYMKSKDAPLKRDVDYTVEYENNTQIGTATVIITGMGNCTGTKRATFKITGTSLAKAKVSGITEKTYNGYEQMQQLTLTLNNTELAVNKDYKVTYDRNLDAGTARITITGVGKYTGTIKKTFKINPYLLKDSMITGSQDSVTVKYVKGGSKPKVTLQFRDENGKLIRQLTEGSDYKVTYANNKKIAAATARKAPTITIKGNGNFKGTLSRKFAIEKKALNDRTAPVTMTVADVGAASGAGKYISKPILTDSDGKVLKANTDYTVEYRLSAEDGTLLNNKSKVDADQEVYVTVTGKGSYTGTLKGRYRVAKNSFRNASIRIDAQIYTGKPLTLSETAVHVTMKGNSGELKLGTDYEIVEGSYVNNVKKGNASVTLRGLNDYGGTKTVKFKINTRKIRFISF